MQPSLGLDENEGVRVPPSMQGRRAGSSHRFCASLSHSSSSQYLFCWTIQLLPSARLAVCQFSLAYTTYNGEGAQLRTPPARLADSRACRHETRSTDLKINGQMGCGDTSSPGAGGGSYCKDSKARGLPTSSHLLLECTSARPHYALEAIHLIAYFYN